MALRSHDVQPLDAASAWGKLERQTDAVLLCLDSARQHLQLTLDGRISVENGDERLLQRIDPLHWGPSADSSPALDVA